MNSNNATVRASTPVSHRHLRMCDARAPVQAQMNSGSPFTFAGREGVSSTFLDTLVKMQTGVVDITP